MVAVLGVKETIKCVIMCTHTLDGRATQCMGMNKKQCPHTKLYQPNVPTIIIGFLTVLLNKTGQRKKKKRFIRLYVGRQEPTNSDIIKF